MQLKLNFNHCIFDNFEIPENDKWIYELKEKKDRYEVMLKTIFGKNYEKR